MQADHISATANLLFVDPFNAVFSSDIRVRMNVVDQHTRRAKPAKMTQYPFADPSHADNANDNL